MPIGSPAIACIGVIGRHDNPLHISLFAHEERQARDELEFEFLLSSSIDIFESRLPQKVADHDFGLLQAIDDRLAMYGWLTNTGIKFVVIVDMEARPPTEATQKTSPVFGVRDSDLKPAFRALHSAYIKVLRNPFYNPDGPLSELGSPQQITSPRFVKEVQRIGQTWYPGITGM